jgi:phosphatidylinositol alpha 1,6-mannosyltransferase
MRAEMTFGDPSGFLCVYVGRISEEKRLEVLLEAMKLLKGDRKTYFAIIGDGPLASKFAQMHSKENRIYCKPRFLSHSELAEVYASADVHVSASEFETLGNTVLEAFGCGIPVVVPRTQGFQDTVQHEQNGYLFNPKDSIDAAKYLQLLKDDPLLLRRLGENGQHKVQAFSYAKVVEDMIRWYSRGISSKQQQSPFYLFVKFLILATTVSLAIVMHAIYDPMVSHMTYVITSFNQVLI